MNETYITTRFSKESDANDATIDHLTNLINRVYHDAESDLWKPGHVRTTKKEVEQHLKNSQLILAELHGEIVGSVFVQKLNEEVAEFGMLVASLEHRHSGIGKSLVQAVETWATHAGFKTMRLELLTPRAWKNPSKEFLTKWYSRIGYQPQFTEPFEKMYPDKIDALATECDFTVWLKRLN